MGGAIRHLGEPNPGANFGKGTVIMSVLRLDGSECLLKEYVSGIHEKIIIDI